MSDLPSYASALRRLFSLDPGRQLPGRDRLARLLERAGHPERAAPSVLVGGTNGKGRLVAALSAAMSTRYRTGAFIKPHLKTVRERWRINDTEVSEQAFTAAATATCDLIERHGEPISYFEANVLLGALLFREADCELAIWEVGLGGRYDACNLVEPCVSILTGVGYDHQAILGSTLAEIAWDKAYIARAGRKLILAPPRPGWEAAYAEYAPVVASVCQELGAEYVPCAVPSPADWAAHARTPWGLPPDTRLLLDTALPELAAAGFPLAHADVAAGLARMRYRCRMERTTLEGQPVLLDAAHNVDALRWLAQVLERDPFVTPTDGVGTDTAPAPPRYPLVFACQTSREPRELLAELKPIAACITPIEVPVLHPCPAGRIAQAARELDIPLNLPPGSNLDAPASEYEIGATTELDPPDDRTGWIACVRHALSAGTPARPVVICGSIYALGEVLRAFEPQD